MNSTTDAGVHSKVASSLTLPPSLLSAAMNSAMHALQPPEVEGAAARANLRRGEGGSLLRGRPSSLQSSHPFVASCIWCSAAVQLLLNASTGELDIVDVEEHPPMGFCSYAVYDPTSGRVPFTSRVFQRRSAPEDGLQSGRSGSASASAAGSSNGVASASAAGKMLLPLGAAPGTADHAPARPTAGVFEPCVLSVHLLHITTYYLLHRCV